MNVKHKTDLISEIIICTTIKVNVTNIFKNAFHGGLSVAGSPLLANLECRVTDVLLAAFCERRDTLM